MYDCVVIGGGAVGLSIAYELSRYGVQVQLIERGLCGQEASWAGAGILPASGGDLEEGPYERLAGLSGELHVRWAEDLQNATGVDTGYRRCSEIFLEREEIPGDPLSRDRHVLEARGVRVETLDREALEQLEPHLTVETGDEYQDPIYHTPDSAQIRNPRYLQALKIACQQQGVQIVEQAEVHDFDWDDDRIATVHTSAGPFSADQFCLAAGAWTMHLAEMLGCRLAVKPIRGQMALLKCRENWLQNIIHRGGHYLVPRLDGRVLVGSTLEDVGFEKKTTVSAITTLLQFAQSVVPHFSTAELERCWAGFRPASPDGYPYIDAVPGFTNGWIAAGHYRWGLFLSPGTAVLMRQLIRGEPTSVPSELFRIGRSVEPVA